MHIDPASFRISCAAPCLEQETAKPYFHSRSDQENSRGECGHRIRKDFVLDGTVEESPISRDAIRLFDAENGGGRRERQKGDIR